MTTCQGVFHVSVLRNDIQKHSDPNFPLEYQFTTTQRKELPTVNHWNNFFLTVVVFFEWIHKHYLDFGAPEWVKNASLWIPFGCGRIEMKSHIFHFFRMCFYFLKFELFGPSTMPLLFCCQTSLVSSDVDGFILLLKWWFKATRHVCPGAFFISSFWFLVCKKKNRPLSSKEHMNRG